MDIYETFVTKPEELSKRFQVIREQGVPKIFDKHFLADLGFQKPNSVLYVKLFKTLGLIDEKGQPDQSLYPSFVKSENQSKLLLARLVKKKYVNVFETNNHAHKLPEEKLFELFQKQMDSNKSDTIVKLVANTFKVVSQYADWDSFQNQNSNQSSNFMQANKSQEVNPKEADTPHEEFILELMNGESSHDYSNGSNGTQTVMKQERNTDEDEISSMNEQIEKIIGAPDKNGEHKKKTETSGKGHSIFLSKALIRRAELLEDMDKFQEAIEAYDEIISYSDSNQYPLGQENITNAYYKKASLLEKLDKCEKALNAYNEFIQRFG